jgi:hypothetical protein
MNPRNTQRGPTLNRTLLVMLALSCLALICLADNSYAQQEPTRQLVQANSANPNTGKRLALVIGNGAYTTAPPLRNPPNDARDMAATLRVLGFDVMNGINVNQRDMKRLIREFGQKLRSGASGLFYYAGHGVQSKGRNYLVPVDADIQSEAEVEDSGVDVSLVLNYMDDAQNGLNIVILDACRNNPFARSFRSAGNGLAQVDAPTGTLIAYATAPGRVAADGVGRNGLYTSELLKQMQVPGLSATEMFMRVRAEVMKQTASKQVPWEASSLVGTFYFTSPRKGAESGTTGVANETKFDPAAFELSYWETIKMSSNAEDFKAYLEKYPNGQFATLAKNRINSLAGPPKLDETRSTASEGNTTELAFWDAIKTSNDPEDFRAYLKKYPSGAFLDLANNRINSLSAEAKERARAAATPKEEPPRKFEVRNGKSKLAPKGTLFISASGVDFVEKDHLEKKKWAFACTDVNEASVPGFPWDKIVFRIRAGKDTHNFMADSGSEAKTIVETIRAACKLDQQGKKP